MKLVKEIDSTGEAIFKSAVKGIFHFSPHVQSSLLTSSSVMYDEDVTGDSSDEISFHEASEPKGGGTDWISQTIQRSKPSPKRKKSVDVASTRVTAFTHPPLVQAPPESESSDEEKEAETPTKRARVLSLQEKTVTPSKMKKTPSKSPASPHGRGKSSGGRLFRR